MIMAQEYEDDYGMIPLFTPTSDVRPMDYDLELNPTKPASSSTTERTTTKSTTTSTTTMTSTMTTTTTTINTTAFQEIDVLNDPEASQNEDERNQVLK